MQYSKEAIDFFSGDIKISYEIVPIYGVNQLMVDVTRYYTNGETRTARYVCDEFIESIYGYKRYLMGKVGSPYKKYQIAIHAKYDLQSEIREFEREISKSELNVKKYDYSQIKEELDTVIEAYRINYENIWWRVKLPIIISIVAFGMSTYTFIDNLQKNTNKSKSEQAKTQPTATKPATH